MAKYNILVRRNNNEDWSPWCNTNDDEVFYNNIKTIEANNWRWTLETPMDRKIFKETCLARGISESRINSYVVGRIKFVTDDIEILEYARYRR